MLACAVAKTLAWLDGFVIKHQICPFAAPVRNHVRTVVCDGGEDEAHATLAEEWRALASCDPQQPATTLVVLPGGAFDEFETFMHFQETSADTLGRDDDGEIQLLAFHPDATFEEGDAADVSMQSPYPMLHLLRHTDVEAAEVSWAARHAPGEPPGIQERNAAWLRGLGLEEATSLARAAVDRSGAA